MGFLFVFLKGSDVLPASYLSGLLKTSLDRRKGSRIKVTA